MYLADNWSTVPRWAGPIIAYERVTCASAIERSECGTAQTHHGAMPDRLILQGFKHPLDPVRQDVNLGARL